VDNLFPFGFPWPTALYLTLYVLTLTLHMLLMHYVLAGSAWVAWTSIIKAFRSDSTDPSNIVKVLQDWLPFALGGAITAGVAPLLFVQILYQREFYTANLLLFHRWMSILPVLIVAFYLLYLQKSSWLDRRSWLRPIVWLTIISCFVFVGYSWTENHLLSLQPQVVWTNFFASRELFFARVEILPRLLIWIAGAFSTLCTFLAWQMHFQQWNKPNEASVASGVISSEVKLIARVGLLSLIVTFLATGIYGTMLGDDVLSIVRGPLAWPFVAAVGIGWGVQFAVWFHCSIRVRISQGLLLLLPLTVVTTTLSLNVVREVIRLANVDIAALATRHAEAASVGGFGVFVFFLIANSLLVFWLLRSVARSVKSNRESTPYKSTRV
jgi:hypothetical protein